jgi:hypothetical protein
VLLLLLLCIWFCCYLLFLQILPNCPTYIDTAKCTTFVATVNLVLRLLVVVKCTTFVVTVHLVLWLLVVSAATAKLYYFCCYYESGFVVTGCYCCYCQIYYFCCYCSSGSVVTGCYCCYCQIIWCC